MSRAYSKARRLQKTECLCPILGRPTSVRLRSGPSNSSFVSGRKMLRSAELPQVNFALCDAGDGGYHPTRVFGLATVREEALSVTCRTEAAVEDMVRV